MIQKLARQIWDKERKARVLENKQQLEKKLNERLSRIDRTEKSKELQAASKLWVYSVGLMFTE